MVVTNYKDAKKDKVIGKYSKGGDDTKYAFTLLQHLDWALNRAGNYAGDAGSADFSKIGNDEVLFMVAHGPKGGKKSGDYTGKDLAAFLCDKKKGLPGTWKKKEIYVTSCYAGTGGAASVINTMAAELKSLGKTGIKITGADYTTVTHKDVNSELYVVIDETEFDKLSDSMMLDTSNQAKILDWVKWVSTNTGKTLPELATETSKRTKDAYVKLVQDANKVKALDSEKNKCISVTS